MVINRPFRLVEAQQFAFFAELIEARVCAVGCGALGNTPSGTDTRSSVSRKEIENQIFK